MKNLILVFVVILLFSTGGCGKRDNPVIVPGIPSLAATTAVSAITKTTATSGGNITADGGASVTTRGVCWSTSSNPTTANSKTANGTGTGTFVSSLTGLTDGTLYYVRAYATNSAGTGYGTQVSFTTGAFTVNVKNTGATGNGSTDDTRAIQTAVNQVAGTGGTVLVPDGTYMINALTSLKLGSYMTFKMEAGAVLKAIPNDAYGYSIVKIENASNVIVIGGTIKGERNEHLTPGNIPAPPYTDPKCPSANSCYGQWGFGIRISGGSNIYIDGVLAMDCWGDGFYVDGHATNVNFFAVTADYNRRQGLSIVDASGVVVKNSIFKNTRGHNPQAGIDLEPDAGKSVTNVQILNCQFYDNYHSGIALNGQAAPLNNVTIAGNTSVNSKTGMRASSCSSITVNNNTIIAVDAGLFTYGGLTGSTITGNTLTSPVCFSGDFTGNTISPNTCLNGSVLTVHPASLSFGNVTTGSSSPEQSYNLAGGYLTSDVTVTAPVGYEISKTSGTGFASSITVTQVAGKVAKSIYVRFKPGASQAYGGDITNASAGATTKNVTITGTGTGKDNEKRGSNYPNILENFRKKRR
jgi:polygalacturonase